MTASRSLARSRSDGMKVEFMGNIGTSAFRWSFLSSSRGPLSLPLQNCFTTAVTTKNSLPSRKRSLRQAQQYESYLGINVKLQYFICVTMSRRMADVVKDRDIWVHSFLIPPDSNNPIKMEVGIEDCLHIEFEYNKSKYHLKDVIVRKISCVSNQAQSSQSSAARPPVPNQCNESQTITKFKSWTARQCEVSRSLPSPTLCPDIDKRYFLPRRNLGGFDLTPTFRDVNKSSARATTSTSTSLRKRTNASSTSRNLGFLGYRRISH
ncbi:vacuolar protein sorting-associated protein 26-domain-containing protein [Lactarius hatsudake]|nr:vacuolar protein sorting-associated protein 26-domain-containing protein [Lactarius hatsudake]